MTEDEDRVKSPEPQTEPQIRILIVAKKANIRTEIEVFAHREVQGIDTAGSLEEALDILNKEPGKYNALIAYKDMGREDEGLELTRRATEQFPGLVCGLIIRGATLLVDDETLKKNGVRFVFREPLRAKEIIDIVERMKKEVISQRSN